MKRNEIICLFFTCLVQSDYQFVNESAVIFDTSMPFICKIQSAVVSSILLLVQTSCLHFEMMEVRAKYLQHLLS